MAEGAESVQAIVEIDGLALPAELKPVMEQVVVDNHLLLADAFSITFRDLDRTILDRAKVKVASKVRISGTELGGITPVLLIAGDVTSIEADYHERGARVIIRGYDASHRMSVGRTTKTFKDTRDSDIAKIKAGLWGIDVGVVDDSEVTHEHVSQVNVSDWEFLKARAREIGFELSVSDGKLNFRKPKPASTAPANGSYTSTNPLQLVMGKELLEFRPRVTGAGQVTDVAVRSWDYLKKMPIEHQIPAETTSVALKDNGRAFAQRFSSPHLTVVNRPYATQAEVDKATAALSDEVASTWAEADGVARGNPKIRAGSPANVSVVAEPFAGRYTLTRTRHIFDHEGYRTEFVVSGRQERSLLGLTSPGAGSGSPGGSAPIYGLVIGKVTDVDDPKKLGRVKLSFPWLDKDYESDWARMSQMGAGPDSGAFWLAEVGDEVLVGFEFGDVNHPFVVGNLYNGKDKPKLGDGLFDHGKLKRRGFISRKGHKVIFFDDPGKSGIAIISANGQMKVSVNETSGEIHIKSDKKVTIESGTDMKLKATGSLELEGQAGVKVKSSAIVEVSGSLIKLN